MQEPWIAILPFLLVIPIAIFTKQVQAGLFAGLLLGSYLRQPDLFGGLKAMLAYLVNNMIVSNNIRIVLFLYVFAGLIHVAKMAGGIKGFVHLVGKKIATARAAVMLTWLSTVGTFSNPDLRIVTVAPIMKALRPRLNLPTQNIGFIIEVTSNPVVVLIPIATAFVGYMVSIVAGATQSVGITEPAYTLYVKSIPFNFFSWVILALGVCYSFFRQSNPEVNSSDQALQEGQTDQELEECHRAFEKDTPSKPWNLILPLALVVLLTLFLTWWDGHFQAAGFLDAFLRADALGVMLEALFITLIFTIIFLLLQRIPIIKIASHFVQGGNELMSVIVLLVLIWALAAVSEDLGFSKFITLHLGWIPHGLIAPAIFLLGSLISYFIGSSFGTWGLLMPLAITLAQQSGENIPLVMGAVFASGTFGGFASPLSDNTVTLCTILDLPLMEYSRWKLKPALLAAGGAAILYALASFLFT